ncbi:hypothetical protein EWM64_g3612 [Hericium alpestre]|uniref:DDE Tnp4 domain-containing protein n=1 Tax=Hericium alpestre TaxID=135208 RepID=A0A4Z0A2F4_9AGAM|nr:hypothetical protein EWM64_g3612 [Hericium alpestre]
MDDLGLQHLLSQMEEEDYLEEEQALRAAAMIAILIYGAEEARLSRIRRRHPSRLYLCRPQLLPDPRGETPWQRLFESESDRAFITTMGVDVATFYAVLLAGFSEKWYGRPIPRTDTDTQAEPRPHRRSLDAAGALGLVLHYLNSTMHEVSLQQIFALIPATVSRYITFGLDILLETLRNMEETAISWPRTLPEFEELSTLIVARHPRLQGAFGTIDGLNLLVQTSHDMDIENATFNGWLSEHFISSILGYSSKGLIIAALVNAPGSWHDSRVARPIYRRLLEDTPDGFYLVADSAFPRGTAQIEGRIQAPLKIGQQIWGLPEEIEERNLFNRELLSYRQTAEWGMRALQGSFGRLRVPLEIRHSERRANLLETCVRLHNLHTNRVGINQIQAVYCQHWRYDAEQEAVWSSFEDMLFSEQRKRDRVSIYHTVATY